MRGAFTSLRSGLPLCRAWPGAPREGPHCCLYSRFDKLFSAAAAGLAHLAGLPRPRASSCVLRPLLTLLAWLFKQVLSPGLVSPGLGASDPAGPWPRQAHHGGLFQGLGFMAKARDMLVSAIRHHKRATGESQHKAMAPSEATPSASPRWEFTAWVSKWLLASERDLLC